MAGRVFQLRKQTSRGTRRTEIIICPCAVAFQRVLADVGYLLALWELSSCSPTPVIRWSKKDGDLPTRKVKLEDFGKTLRMMSMSDENAGEYVCTATNRMGFVSHTVAVHVQGPLLYVSFFSFAISVDVLCIKVDISY